MEEPCGEMINHLGMNFYVGWMREKIPGEADFGMWLNEQPNGGFKWSFLDFKPEDVENYCRIWISANNPKLLRDKTIEDLESKLAKYRETLKWYADEKNWKRVEGYDKYGPNDYYEYIGDRGEKARGVLRDE